MKAKQSKAKQSKAKFSGIKTDKRNILTVYKGGKKVAKQRTKRASHKKSMTIPLAMVAGFVPYVLHMKDLKEHGGSAQMWKYSLKPFWPVDPFSGKFETNDLKFGLTPVTLGFIAHALASRLGVNRMIARTGLPFIRI